MSQSVRFLVACASFHSAVVVVCLWAGRRWLDARAAPPRRRAVLLLVGAPVVGTALVALASVASLFTLPSGFTVLRLVSQALFAEVLALVAAIACAEWALSMARGAIGLALSLGMCGVYWEGYHRGPEDLHVETHALDLSRGAPVGRLRLLHLSDLQTSDLGPWEERVLAEARRLRPDLVVWTGDYVQPRLAPTRLRAEVELREFLRRQPVGGWLGSYAVRGDVDIHWPATLDGTGIVTMSGDAVRIPLPGGRTLRLVGLGSGTSRGRDRAALARELGEVPAGDLSLVAGHNPSYVRLLPGLARVDLALAGHTHGGQVAFPLLGAPYTKSLLPRRYARGLNDYQGIPVHVSGGIGMERGAAPQVRFLSPPEICLLEITY
jgi:predicted MPP superfamily phosphohydrolase